MDGNSTAQGSENENSSSSSSSSSSSLGMPMTIKIKRGAWSAQEDSLLINYIKQNGVKCCWRKLPLQAGLMRSGKSCRLRWMNYLRPDVKIGGITLEEEDLIVRLHKLLGNRWSLIAGRLPGRTDNEIKNYWKGHIRRHLTKITSTPKSSRKSTEGKGTNANPNSCGINILCQVDQPIFKIDDTTAPFIDLGTNQILSTNSSTEAHENGPLLEKKTSTTNSTNYPEPTQDYEPRPFLNPVDANNKTSVLSVTEEGRNDMWSSVYQQVPWIDEYSYASQILSTPTYTNSPYGLQGDMHPLAHHFSVDDASPLMV